MKRSMTRTSALAVLLLLANSFAGSAFPDHAQDSERKSEESHEKGHVGAFPVIFYSDETRLAAGGGTQIVSGGQDGRLQSSLGLMSFITQNRQYLFIAAPEIYMKNNSYKLTGNFGYSYFPNTFYGLGNDTSKDDEEKYTGRLYRINPVLQKEVIPNLFIGIQYDYFHGKTTKTADGGMLEKGVIPGSKAGGASGAGINITWDTRDNNLYPFSGAFHQLTVSSYGPSIGSDYSFSSFLLDLRRYHCLFDTHVLAFQGVMCINTGSPSFQYMNEMSSLGRYLRGYERPRFVDKNVLAFQAEYRMPLCGRFGCAAFAGFGQVADKVANINWGGMKPSCGLGLRFALVPEQKINLRVDMGVGKDDGSFDLSLMESF